MNLDKLIDQYIGEEKVPNPKYEQVEISTIYLAGYNQALQDLKSRKQELIEGIESFYASQK
jgi:hypothetical protein